MSSISRRRNGLMALSVIGGSCLGGGSRPLNLKTGRLLLATPRVATNYRDSGLVVCPACSIAWGWKSPIQPDGGEGLAKHKGVIARGRLRAGGTKPAPDEKKGEKG